MRDDLSTTATYARKERRNEMNNKRLYGWYSQKEADYWARHPDMQMSPVKYLTPDNEVVMVTEVISQDQSLPPDRSRLGNFDDFVFLGEVTRFVGRA